MVRQARLKKRRRWAVLNVTEEERDLISRYARETNISVNSYIVQRSLQKPVSSRSDYKRYAIQQAKILDLLECIAYSADVKRPGQSAPILATLLAIDKKLESFLSSDQIIAEDYIDDSVVERENEE